MKASSTLSTASDDSRRSSGDTAFLSHPTTKEEMKQAVIKRLDIGANVLTRTKKESTTSTSSGRCPSSRLISSSTRSNSTTSSSYILDYNSVEKSSFEVREDLHPCPTVVTELFSRLTLAGPAPSFRFSVA